MLTRLFVDNYKTLQNFEFRPTHLCVLVGENGAGKTTIGSVLHAVNKLLTGRITALEAFPTDTLCRWSQSDRQVVELEHAVARGIFVYRVELLHDRSSRKVAISTETLKIDGSTVYEFRDGRVTVGSKDGPPSSYSFQTDLSFLPHLDDATARGPLGGFKALIDGQLTLKPDPLRMEARSEAENDGLRMDASNFSSWWRFIVQKKPAMIGRYFSTLSSALPGFRALTFEQAGREVKVLKATFDSPNGAVDLSLDELSDGQRQLLLLYLLLQDIEEGHVTFLDEPDNFISIREVQPWLSELERVLVERGAQAIIVSHATEAMDYLDSRKAFTVTRPHGGPTQIAPLDGSDGTKASSWVLFGESDIAGVGK